MALKSKKQILDKLYKDIHSPVSFTTVEPLWKEARKQRRDIARNDVQKYLESQRTYTLHRRAVRRYPRMVTLAPGLHTEWQADLADFQRLSKENQGFKYLLVCIDTLSRQLFAEPVKSKSPDDMIASFDRLFSRVSILPWKLKTDAGKEFTAKRVQDYFARLQIQHFTMYTSPKFHAGMAERANRTIKERLYRYFTERSTQNWVDVIQDLVTAINHSYNSTIRMRPVDANFENANQLRKALEQNALKRFENKPRIRFKCGDQVRIEKHKHVFQKGYTPNFTNELFTIDTIRNNVPYQPTTFRLRDRDGNLIKGWFYVYDLSKFRSEKDVRSPMGSNKMPLYDIEKVLRNRRRNGVEYLFVKWRGYASEHNSWIPASSLVWKEDGNK